MDGWMDDYSVVCENNTPKLVYISQIDTIHSNMSFLQTLPFESVVFHFYLIETYLE